MENMNGTSMEAIFSESANSVEAKPVEKQGKSKTDAARKLKEALETTLSSDPTFEGRVKTLSNSLEVVHTLGFGEHGSIIVDEAKTTATKRGLAQTSAIVGYEVRNCGDQPIQYKTGVCTPDANGVYTSEEVTRVLNPGETAYLTRKYMTILCACPEISFTLRNGTIVKGSGATNTHDQEAILKCFYFTFDKDLNMKVNSDEVKVRIDDVVDGHSVVKSEYVEAFGTFNNKKETKKRASKAGSQNNKFDTAVRAANYVYNIVLKKD